jgi:hypothetical protein
MPTWKGAKKAFQGTDLEFTPGVGVRTMERWEGDKTSMSDLFNSYANSGWQVRCSRNSGTPVWVVEASVQGDPNAPDGSDLVDIHELHGNVLNPSNLSSPFLKSQLGGGDAAALKLAYIKQVYDDYRSRRVADYGEAVADLADPATSPITDNNELMIAQRVLDDLIQGVNHYIQFQFVYRHTYNFGPIRSLRVNPANVGAIFTPAELIAAENIPSIEADDIQEIGGEWLKVFPSKRNELGQRRQVVREYWWAEEISRLYYPTAV